MQVGPILLARVEQHDIDVAMQRQCIQEIHHDARHGAHAKDEDALIQGRKGDLSVLIFMSIDKSARHLRLG